MGGKAPHRKVAAGTPGEITNSEVAAMFRTLADLLAIEGANPFRVEAYRRAARIVEGLPRPVAAMVAEGEDLTRFYGIGKDLAGKIRTIVETGRLPLLDEMLARMPEGLLDLLSLPGLGPARVRLLHEQLGIETLRELEDAIRAGKLRRLPGFGPKTEEKILAAIARMRHPGGGRRLLAEVEETARAIETHLGAFPGTIHAAVAGSFRRRKESVGDLDCVMAVEDGAGAIRHFLTFPRRAETVSAGITRATILLDDGLQVDLRVVAPESWGTTLAYFTGSRAHTLALRHLAREKGWKLNEYGLFAGERRLAGPTEAGLYAAFGMEWIPPELREMRGELAAASAHRLPELATRADIRGDGRVRGIGPDGRVIVARQAEAARRAGLAWLGIADPMPGSGLRGALAEDALSRRAEAIARWNRKAIAPRLLPAGIFAIDPSGRIRPDPAPWRARGLVIVARPRATALHEDMTDGVEKAIATGLIDILATPTGRRVLESAEFSIDPVRLIEAARANDVCLEICGIPQRLDLSDVHARMARKAGARILLASAATTPERQIQIGYALDQARRGWLEAKDLVNTRDTPPFSVAISGEG